MCFLVALTFLTVLVDLSRQGDDVACLHEYTYDYRYTKSYELAEVAKVNNYTTKLEVTIMGKSDAHIRLTPHYFVDDGDVYYEIVLGAGGNSYSSIRKKPRNYADLDRQSTRNILSAYTPYIATVKIEKDRIIVSNNKTGKTLLSGQDLRIRAVKYVSYSAWDGVSVFFTFGCKTKLPPEQATASPGTEEYLTAAERWRRDFLSQYDPYAVPVHTNDTLLVRIGFAVNYLFLDSKVGQLTTRGNFNISWIDPKMKWNPDLYEGLEEMYFDTRSIWRPDFTLLDSPGINESPLLGNVMRVIKSGQVIWKPSGQLVTRCRSEASSDWPRDRHNCAIRLALYANPELIQLSPMNDAHEFSLAFVNSRDLDIEVMSMESEIVTRQEITSPITFGFKLSLQRRVDAFSILFIIPLTAITALTHCGLYLPPSSSARTFIHSVTLVGLAIYLMMQERILPAGTTVPLIMKLTCGAFMLAVVHIIYSSSMSCLILSRRPVPKKVLDIISAKWTNYILFCPVEIYNEFSNEGRQRDFESSCESQWLCVARFFDKVVQLTSTVYLGVLFIMLMAL